MSDLEYSDDKVRKLKDKLYYYHHLSSLNKRDKLDLNLIPESMLYFSANNKPIDALTFYTSSLTSEIALASDTNVDYEVLVQLNNLSYAKKLKLKVRIDEDEDFWDRLLDRSYSTYRLDFNRNSESKFNPTLLSVFQSSYENTEIMKILFWITQGLIDEPLIQNFSRYEDNKGNIKKGVVINDIRDKLKKKASLAEFTKIVENAYYSELRHLGAHTNAKFDDDNQTIINIDKGSVAMTYHDAIESFYSLQQLQNHLKMFANILRVDNNKIINEGIMSLGALNLADKENILALFQLKPFYENDLHNNIVKEITIKVTDNQYVFDAEKELIRVDKNDEIDDLINIGKKLNQILIVSLTPDIFIENSNYLQLSNEYGDFICEDYYIVENVNIIRNCD